MKPYRPTTMIAGRRLLACPRCGATVREDLLDAHATRCAAAPANAAAVQTKPASRGDRQTQKPLGMAESSRGVADNVQRERKKPAKRGVIVCPTCHLPVPSVHLAEHRLRCELRNAKLRQHQPSSPEAASKQRHTMTLEGYEITTCWDCGRRVCLVSNGLDIAATHDIAPGGTVGDMHLCDGEKSGERHSKLIYVNPCAASVAPSKDKKGSRKV